MIHWVDHRFGAWGRWVQLGRGLGSKGLTVDWQAVGRSTVRQAFVPVKDIECSRTDDWVRALADDERLMMYQVYCTPDTSREHARKLSMSLRTLYARLHALQARYSRRDQDRQAIKK